MSNIKPKLDNRNIDEILKKISLLADSYTQNRWEFSPDRNNDDLGSSLSKIFADMYMKILNRFNKVPEKNFIEFLNMCNFYLNSLTTSIVPVTLKIPNTLDQGLFISTGKKLSAKSKNGEDELVFETCNDILVTNSEISNIYSTVNEKDLIYNHKLDVLEKKEFYFFKNTNEDKQKHILYIGHDSLFNFESDVQIEIEFVLPENTDEVKKKYLETIFESMSAWEYNWIIDKNGNETNISRFLHAVSLKDSSIVVTLNKNKPSFTQENKNGKIPISEINGIQSHWIRCRLLDNNAGKKYAYKNIPKFIDSRNIPFIENITVKAKLTNEKVYPDFVFYNSFRLNPMRYIKKEGDDIFEYYAVLPFGSRPATYDAFYIGSNDVFSKRNADVTVNFIFDRLKRFFILIENSPLLSWEYWDGNGWNTLFLLEDNLTNIKFTCPYNISQTLVNGYSNFWIRLRILSGDYGKPIYHGNPNGNQENWEYDKIYYPIIENDPYDRRDIMGVNIEFEYNDSNLDAISHDIYCITFNNLQFENHITKIHDKGKNIEPFKPFISLHEYDPNPYIKGVTTDNKVPNFIYIGFNKKIKEGPINIYLSLIEYQSNYSIDQNLDVYYSSKDGWKKLESFVNDTKYLMKSGWMKLYFPDDFEQMKLFENKSAYWLKIIDSRDEFNNCSKDPNIEIKYPHIRGIYLNNVQARGSLKITDEILLYNDNDNSFSFSKYPLSHSEKFKEEIWVKERKDLIENQVKEELDREYFYLNKLDRIRVIRDILGKSHEIWVKWEETGDISLPGRRERYFELDRVNGKLYLGNDVNSISITREANIVRATYFIGGGHKYNVEINQIIDAKDFIPFLESINNPEQGYGGYDMQAKDSAQKYWPELIKTRNQLVSFGDFESLISNKFTFISSVKCFPVTNEKGKAESGHVTIVIVPLQENSNQDGIFQPLYPHIQLLEDIKEYVQKYSSNLVLNLSKNLHIIGPVYIKTSVSLTIFLKQSLAEETSKIKKESLDLLNNFLNPFTGGLSGFGWDLGYKVSKEEISSLFGNIRYIEGVGDIEIVYDENKKYEKLSLPFNSIIYSSFDHRLSFVYIP